MDTALIANGLLRPNGVLKLALTLLSKLVRLFDFSARDTSTVHD